MNSRRHRGTERAGRVVRRVAALGLCLFAAGSSGAQCGAGILNPQFQNRLSGTLFPIAPGSAPFVLIEVINNTNFEVTFLLTTEDSIGSRTENLTTTPALPRQAKIVACPVTQIALGTPGDPDSPAIRVITNPVTGAFLEIPFIDPATGRSRNALTEGASFLCGDTVIFLVSLAPTQPGRVAVTVGRIDGGSQLGPFSGPATFDNLLDVATIIPPEGP